MYGDDSYSRPATKYTDPMLYKSYLKKQFGISREAFAKDGILKESIDLLPEVCREDELSSDLFLATAPGKKMKDMRENSIDCSSVEGTKIEDSLNLLTSQVKSILGGLVLSAKELQMLKINANIRRELAHFCPNKISLKGIKTHSISLGNQTSSISFFDRILNSNNVFAIRFNEHFLRKKTPGVSLNLSPDNSRHFSTIIGRRWNERNNSCEYLVRNIWGDSCRWYDPEINECVNGHIWVEENTLAKSTADATYIE